MIPSAVQRMSNVQVDGEEVDLDRYVELHRERISWTLNALRRFDGRRVVEVGSHPWVMTAAIMDDPELELLATISAEESLQWPDNVHPTKEIHDVITPVGNRSQVKTYCFNIERRRMDIAEKPDAVLACEVIEHLIRSPHIMLLNINDWLATGGLLVITTPNGCQMRNPLERSTRSPAYRAHCYERHNFIYSVSELEELVELCGFEILESGFSSPYPSTGTQLIRKLLASLPSSYLREKFARMIFIVARKAEDVKSLTRTPSIYSPSASWDFIVAPPNS
jgi:hypothetical protein